MSRARRLLKKPVSMLMAGLTRRCIKLEIHCSMTHFRDISTIAVVFMHNRIIIADASMQLSPGKTMLLAAV